MLFDVFSFHIQHPTSLALAATCKTVPIVQTVQGKKAKESTNFVTVTLTALA